MSGGSKNNDDDITDDFTNFGVSVRRFLRARPKAVTAHRLAIFDAVLDGVESIQADEMAHITSNHADELQAKDTILATALVEKNKEISDWKEKAEVGATELKKKEGAHATVLEKMNKEINERKEQATADAATIGKLQADKEEWTAEKKRMTDKITNLTGQVNAKDEKVRRLKKGGKAEKARCDTFENFTKQQEIQKKKDEEALKRFIEKQNEDATARTLAFERDLRKRRESTDSAVSDSSSA